MARRHYITNITNARGTYAELNVLCGKTLPIAKSAVTTQNLQPNTAMTGKEVCYQCYHWANEHQRVALEDGAADWSIEDAREFTHNLKTSDRNNGANQDHSARLMLNRLARESKSRKGKERRDAHKALVQTIIHEAGEALTRGDLQNEYLTRAKHDLPAKYAETYTHRTVNKILDELVADGCVVRARWSAGRGGMMSVYAPKEEDLNELSPMRS